MAEGVATAELAPPVSRLAPPVAHPRWRRACEQVIGCLERPPARVALLGPAGTGKTLLLREVARALRQRGHSVVLLEQGDLLFEADPSAVLLVDEAARMNQATLERLVSTHPALVLADMPGFADRLDPVAHAVAHVPLVALAAKEAGDFAAAWLTQDGQDPGRLTEAALERLVGHSDGVPRLLVHLLRAASFMADQSRQVLIDAGDIDEVAKFRDAGMTPPPGRPAGPVDTPSSAGEPVAGARVGGDGLRVSDSADTGAPRGQGRWRLGRMARGQARAPWVRRAPWLSLAGVALLGAVMLPSWSRLKDPFPALDEAPTMGDLQRTPVRGLAALPLAGLAPPEPTVPATPSHDTLLRPAAAPIADPFLPAEVSVEDWAIQAGLSDTREAAVGPVATLALAAPGEAASTSGIAGKNRLPAKPGKRPGGAAGPGLVLVAQPGDTLSGLYRQIYRGVTPPPLSEVTAGNASAPRPGDLLIFPAPPGGWIRR